MGAWRFPYDAILHPEDDFMRAVHGRENTCRHYEHKYALAKRAFGSRRSAPRRVLEIGVRACYSAEAFCAAGATLFHGIDLDADVAGGQPGWVKPAFAALRRRWPDVDAELFIGDSHTSAARGRAAARGPYPLVHVDGDHTFDGAIADLNDYAPLVTRSGLMVVDGVHWDEAVWEATQMFAASRPEWRIEFIPTFGFGGDAVLSKP